MLLLVLCLLEVLKLWSIGSEFSLLLLPTCCLGHPLQANHNVAAQGAPPLDLPTIGVGVP